MSGTVINSNPSEEDVQAVVARLNAEARPEPSSFVNRGPIQISLRYALVDAVVAKFIEQRKIVAPGGETFSSWYDCYVMTKDGGQAVQFFFEHGSALNVPLPSDRPAWVFDTPSLLDRAFRLAQTWRGNFTAVGPTSPSGNPPDPALMDERAALIQTIRVHPLYAGLLRDDTLGMLVFTTVLHKPDMFSTEKYLYGDPTPFIGKDPAAAVRDVLAYGVTP